MADQMPQFFTLIVCWGEEVTQLHVAGVQGFKTMPNKGRGVTYCEYF